ncbi:MAG TPA: ATP-binding protein, partial [Steroidobacteraceae bacterium]|nr:ATP-binding protein [Steroidobacteraceae bacterium]
VTAVLTVVVDINEQKRAQETLQRLNEMLESEVQQRTRERDRIWDVSEDLLGVADARGVWLNVNPAWTRSLGWDLEDVVNKTTQWLEPPEEEISTHDRLSQLREGEAFSFESRLRARGGEYRILSWRGVRLDGAIYSVARDVTEKRVHDAALEQVQDQLRQSQKMEAVGQLTGGIAHDFNNLLTGIIGSLDMLQTRLSQGRHDSVDRYAKAAITSANRAAALTHRLLAFSRRQPLDPRPVAANALLAGMEDMLRRTMGEKIELDITTAGALWLTRCDANQLENAVLNLAINARDAMPHGGRMMIETSNQTLDKGKVATHPGLRPGQYICISVSDTGFGMTPDVLAKAYEPFFTTKPTGQGTGLGLSMIYGFAKQSDGYTRIESEVDKGTTVRIYLPRYLGEIAATEEMMNASGRYRAPQLRTVLVVEDEIVVRNLVIEVLTDLGYRAIEAVSGTAGLNILLSDEVVDLVVSDVGLPELNGREMIERARERRSGLKVLFITGYAENATFGQVDNEEQLITKPFPLEILAQRIREMIGD